MKVLLSPSSFGKLSDIPNQMLLSHGIDAITNPYGRKLTKEETLMLAQDCSGIVAGVEEYDSDILSQLPNLRCISRVGVGVDSIDLEYAETNNIKVLNTPDGPTQAVSELALGLCMSTLRKIPLANSKMKSGIWQKETGFLLKNKLIGIIGVGRIGRKTAEIFRGIGNEIIGCDLHPDKNWGMKNSVKFESLEFVLQNSDILIIHTPGTSNGRPLISDKELNIMKNDSILVNLSRGGVVDEDALVKCLNSNKFTGVAMDVFRLEPYSGPLLNFDRVICTPHLGSYAKEGKIKMEIEAVENLLTQLKLK